MTAQQCPDPSASQGKSHPHLAPCRWEASSANNMEEAFPESLDPASSSEYYPSITTPAAALLACKYACAPSALKISLVAGVHQQVLRLLPRQAPLICWPQLTASVPTMEAMNMVMSQLSPGCTRRSSKDGQWFQPGVSNKPSLHVPGQGNSRMEKCPAPI